MRKKELNLVYVKSKKVCRIKREEFVGVLASNERNQKVLAVRAEKDPEKKKALKAELPGIAWNVFEFTDNLRHNESSVPGPFYFTDYDVKDNPQMGDPREFFENNIKPRLKELHLVVGNASTSKGLHTVGIRPLNATIAEAQKWQASIIGLKHDEACHDDARVAILGHKDDIYHMDLEMLFGEKEPEVFTIPMGENGLASSVLRVNVSAEEIERVRNLEYFGCKLGDIKDRLVKEVTGSEKAPIGKRNWSTYKSTRIIQALGMDEQTLITLFADSGLPMEELKQACRIEANYQMVNGKMPAPLRRIILELHEEQGKPIGQDLLSCRPMPKLPPILRELASSVPFGFVAPLVILSLPILGTIATKVRLRYLDGVIHTLAFMAHVVSKMAGGKSTLISWLIQYLLEKMREHDAIGRQLEQEYHEACRKCKNESKLPEDPKPVIRIVPFTISVAFLLKRLAQAKGMHLLSITDEIDTVRKTNRAGTWSEKTDIYRHAFDNGEYGQDYLSDNSYSGIYKVMYNTVSGGTEESTISFFGQNVLNGLASRVAFTSLPDEFASEMPKFKELTAKQKMIVDQGIQALEEAEGEFKLPRTSKGIEEWLQEKRLLAMETMDPAIDTFYKRSAVIGFRAGGIAYILYGYKETSLVVDFALWIADYVLQQQVAMWGSYIENAQSMQSANPVANLYKELPDEFTREELTTLRVLSGKSDNVRMIISRWKKANMIREVEKNRYAKITIGKA